MPLASGPAELLPYSQLFTNGYTAYRHPEFVEMFHKSMVQLELSRGDAIFFNPALFHAAGENSTTDVRRSADALQISACWGKAMESVDRQAILRATWPDLRDLAARRSGDSDEMRVDGLLQAICDGYSSPTNLDRDPPPANGVSRHIVAPWRARVRIYERKGQS